MGSSSVNRVISIENTVQIRLDITKGSGFCHEFFTGLGVELEADAVKTILNRFRSYPQVISGLCEV